MCAACMLFFVRTVINVRHPLSELRTKNTVSIAHTYKGNVRIEDSLNPYAPHHLKAAFRVFVESGLSGGCKTGVNFHT